MMKLLGLAIFILSLVQNGQSAMVATANIHIDSTQIGVGTLIFYQNDPNAPVRVAGIIDGLKANTVHGFHVHRDSLGMNEFNCTAAGPHFNPDNTTHGPRVPDRRDRHIGDLGNVTANDNGIIIVEIMDAVIDLYEQSHRCIANRTIVLHAMRDDGGQGGFPDSKTTGDAGARIACGTISPTMIDLSATSNPQKISPTVADLFRQLFP